MTRSRAPFLRSAQFRAALALMTLLVVTLATARPAAAHPLGNFSVNQYSKLEIDRTAVHLTYVLDLAELPTVANLHAYDRDSDGSLSESESTYLRDTLLTDIAPHLSLRAGDDMLPLTMQDADFTFQTGQANLQTTRLTAHLQALLPAVMQNETISYTNGYAADRVGWREIVVVNGADIAIPNAAIYAQDQSQGLTSYPADLLTSPLDERTVELSFRVEAGAPASSQPATTTATSPLDFGARLAEIVNGSVTSPAGMLLALLAAMLWGAMHALSPGHGKTVVGAYLVGSRGTPLHALFLGMTVTITHTAGVVALGIVILLASRTIMPEVFYPWLSLASGLMVVLVGVTILRQRVPGLHPAHDHAHAHGDAEHHHHEHGGGFVHTHDGHSHSHLPPGGADNRVTWRNLLALGISGGLLPCPSALLALLGAVALGRAGFGLAVVVAFSLGLAATLTGVGLLFLYAGRLLERRRLPGVTAGLVRFAPAAAALAVTASGALIVARAIGDIW
jgi:ABC-type nickel/cobalt efflux system permease component RcnA